MNDITQQDDVQTIDSSGNYTLTAPLFGFGLGTIAANDVLVTHDSGTPSGQTPTDYLTLFNPLTDYTITATNGAVAIVQGIALGDQVTLNADGGTIETGPSLTLLSNVDITISDGGTFGINSQAVSALSGVSVIFGAGGGTLTLSPLLPIFDALSLNDFGPGDTIDLTSMKYGTTYTVTNSGGNTTVSFLDGLGQIIESVVMQGVTYGRNQLRIAPDGAAGTDISVDVCFLAGTAIATPSGPRDVASLAVGDQVLTADGRTVPVKWIGRRTVEAARIAGAALRAPVRVAADAVAQGKPARDLWVTPDHALFVGGRLIPAKLLVNGTSIRQEALPVYTYFHVELAEHALLLAEGLEAESYLDTGNRTVFAPGGAVAGALEADTAAVYAERGCHELALDPAVTEPVWRRLAARAAELGVPGTPIDQAPTTDAPDLHLIAGERRLAPVAVHGGRYVFALPPGIDSVTLASRAAMPWASRPWIDDRRRLGVAVASVRVTGADAIADVALDGPLAEAGWHAPETTAASGAAASGAAAGGAAGRAAPLRWTDGAARLALPRLDGPCTLEIGVVGTVAYAA